MFTNAKPIDPARWNNDELTWFNWWLVNPIQQKLNSFACYDSSTNALLSLCLNACGATFFTQAFSHRLNFSIPSSGDMVIGIKFSSVSNVDLCLLTNDCDFDLPINLSTTNTITISNEQYYYSPIGIIPLCCLPYTDLQFSLKLKTEECDFPVITLLYIIADTNIRYKMAQHPYAITNETGEFFISSGVILPARSSGTYELNSDGLVVITFPNK